jgi:hypothetical protein
MGVHLGNDPRDRARLLLVADMAVVLGHALCHVTRDRANDLALSDLPKQVVQRAPETVHGERMRLPVLGLPT